MGLNSPDSHPLGTPSYRYQAHSGYLHMARGGHWEDPVPLAMTKFPSEDPQILYGFWILAYQLAGITKPLTNRLIRCIPATDVGPEA